jgi:ribose transport system substrate-binding protein
MTIFSDYLYCDDAKEFCPRLITDLYMGNNSPSCTDNSVYHSDRRRFVKLIGATSITGLAGCITRKPGGGGGGKNTSISPSEVDLSKVEPNHIVGKGPNGNEPVKPEKVTLSEKEVQTLKDGDYTVAIVFHYLKTAWTRLQRRGLTKRFNELGIKVEGIYGSSFDAQKQIGILNTLATKAKTLDAVVSIPVDAVATADAYMNLAEKGIDLVFMDNVPKGFQHQQDYAGCVASDNRGNGLVAGRILAKLVGKGGVGMIKHSAPFYVTRAREMGATNALQNAKGIEIVATNGFTNPNKVYSLAQNMITAYPNMKGVFVIWGVPPGMSVVKAANDTGDSNNPVETTCDLGSRTALNMAQRGMIKGIGAQRPYDQGIEEATLAGNAILGNSTPPYVAVPSLAVMRQNLLDAYRKVFHKKPPQKITKHFE